MKPSETEIQSGICAYLTLRRHFFWRLNNQGVSYIDRHGLRQFRTQHWTPRGLPDIVVVNDGHAVFIEVKSAKGKQSPDQIEFQRNAIKAGADYHVVRSISDVQQLGL